MAHPAPTVEDLLAVLADGPCTADEVVDRLRLGDDRDAIMAVADLLDDRRLLDLPDGRVADAVALGAGIVARHRLTEEEAASRCVHLTDDALVPVLTAVDAEAVLVGGERCEIRALTGDDGQPDLDRPPVVDLPAGWEPGLAAGSLVGLEVTADGTMALTAPGDPGDDDGAAAVAAALRATGEALGQPLRIGDEEDPPRWVADVTSVVLALLADEGELLRSLTVPLTDACTAAGLLVGGGLLGGPGVTEADLGIFRVGWELLGGPGMAAEEADLVEAVGMAWLLIAGAAGDDLPVEEQAAAIAAVASDPAATGALADRLQSVPTETAEAVLPRLRAAVAAAPGRPGAAWLLATAAIVAGQAPEAVAVLDAELLDAGVDDWAEPLALRGHLRAVAGDLPGAISAFRRLEDPEAVEYLQRWVPSAEGVGRNDRCPCGSGRKYKQCCLAHPKPPALAERVELLWWKAQTWCLRAGRETMPWFSSPDPTFDPLVFVAVDAHLVEDGLLGDFVVEMGPVLPDDEARLAVEWLTRSRSLWEVEAVEADRLVLRDLFVDQPLDVRPPREGSYRVGELLLAVVVPSGSGPDQIVGKEVRIPPGEREACLALLAEEITGQDLLDWIVTMGESIDRAAVGPDLG